MSHSDSTSTNASTSAHTGGLRTVSKSEPCPHCGKPDWCYFLGDNLSACKRNAPPAFGWVATGIADKEGTPYYVQGDSAANKTVRPKNSRTWEYPDRTGNRRVRVCRIDDGEGNKKIWQERWNGSSWDKGLKGINRQDIPVYRYGDIRQAIERGETIFIVEGEPCADALWAQGLPATCNIGGSGKWKPSDSKDLQGATVVLCPDRDIPGMAHMEAIAANFPDAQWLFVPPSQSTWTNLPQSGGLDIADWIADASPSVTDIMAAVGQKLHTLPASAPQQNSQKATRPTQVAAIGNGALKVSEYADLILYLANYIASQELSRAKKEAIIQAIAKEYGNRPQDLWRVVNEVEAEAEVAAEMLEISEKLPGLFEAKKERLNWAQVINGDRGWLISLIVETADSMPTAPEYLLTTLLAAASSRMGGARIVINAQANYTQPAIFRTIIVAPSGHKKTPAQQVILEPLLKLESEELHRWKELSRQYERDMANWNKASINEKNAGEPPTPPPPCKRYIISDSTIEAVAHIHEENPRGFLIYRDEAAGYFTARNKYRNGIGDDSELELSEFNGGPLIKDRIKESVYLERSCISRTGSTQWGKLQRLMGEHDDITGEWARWLFCAADAPPSHHHLLPEQKKNIELYDTLRRLYIGLDKIEPADYLLSYDAKVLFQTKQHQLVDMQLQEDHEGLKTAYPKFESYLARFALWLHLVNAVLAGVKPAPAVSGETMLGAIRLVDYFMGQLRLIYAQNAPQSQLSGILLKIQDFAKEKGVPVEVRRMKSGIRALRKSSSAEVSNHCKYLAAHGYGEFRDKKYFAFSGGNTKPPSSGGPSPNKNWPVGPKNPSGLSPEGYSPDAGENGESAEKLTTANDTLTTFVSSLEPNIGETFPDFADTDDNKTADFSLTLETRPEHENYADGSAVNDSGDKIGKTLSAVEFEAADTGGKSVVNLSLVNDTSGNVTTEPAGEGVCNSSMEVAALTESRCASVAEAPAPTKEMPVCGEIETEILGWVELLECADSLEFLGAVSAHYQEVFGEDYERRKQEMWQRLSEKCQKVIRLIKSAFIPQDVQAQLLTYWQTGTAPFSGVGDPDSLSWA